MCLCKRDMIWQFSGFTDSEWEARQQKRYQRTTAADDVFPHSRFFAGASNDVFGGVDNDTAGGIGA